MTEYSHKLANHPLQQRLRRDRRFGRALAAAAVASGAALLAVVGFLLAGALPLLDWRGPGLQQIEQWPMSERPDRLQLDPGALPRAISGDADDGIASVPALTFQAPASGSRCATIGGRRSCYALDAQTGRIELTLQAADCDHCAPSSADRASVSAAPWKAVALLSDQRSLLVALADGELLSLRPYRQLDGQLSLELSNRWRPPGPAITALERVGGADLLLAVNAAGAVYLLDPSLQRWQPFADLDLQLPDNRLFLHADRLLLWHREILGEYRFTRLDTPTMMDLWKPLQSAGQPEPRALWQPHSDDASGTPRLNLIPLVLGSLKAALLGLLFGAPLAIAAAMHSVQYRSGLWRDGLKSSFELMEAVPTVILGLVAGLWVAPWLDQHLGLALGAGFGWLAVYAWPTNDPRTEQNDRRRALQALLRCGLGLLLGGCAGALVEARLPGGRLSAWLEITLGWSYEPYNAVVVGMLVGLAIAPMIYSLAEEALRQAPAGLQEAALALGANRRDTLFGLLLPAAMPGIIVATLMGFGRALGETMIVLLASNNAPIADLNPLSGLRSITATLVLEAPTAVPGSVHYRVLLLATLLLMACTIGLNLLASRWRSRLARKPLTIRVRPSR